MKDLLKNQINLLKSIIESFKLAERALIEKDVQNLTRHISKVEEYSFDFERLEEELNKEINKMGYKSIKEYIEKTNDSEVAYLLATLVENLNELTIVMSNFKNLVDFENKYFEFIKSLFSNSSTTSTYTKKGYGVNQKSLIDKVY
ncbi:hypothetical protein H17ap60334_00917 [Thermosipho africanus H17ap60334]|jgi:hypothetical protein|uniref:Flagellar protein FlgN n=1 Tax=Thermosipho africanus (strain TCF52B) TaxID=484019 RepID=B7IG09_THEAB|nr:flagellar export chaperone FlgN [Thermosipho africanus]ACJ75023.1 conserved hypothetical protein [Thermosipho africanus TCF52B]EKF50247.1 hypothetical protein H17ap60334_00917 [Thermosipho africanus H17ap60334]RDI92476.1 hypothetical protein Ob7_00250 [Thermosipho africanus Ob7]